jgi:CheY-like chemotaxis protein
MKEKALQVLLVEDNAGDARLLREMFSGERPESLELTHLLRMSEAVVHLRKGGVDIALLDLGLPDAHGLGSRNHGSRTRQWYEDLIGRWTAQDDGGYHHLRRNSKGYRGRVKT